MLLENHRATGNFTNIRVITDFIYKRVKEIERQRKAYVNQRTDSKEKEFINRFRSNVKKAAMVQSRIKALEKMEVVKPEAEKKKIYFRFPPSPPASQKVVELEGMSKAYGDLRVFQGPDLRIEKGDRIAVVGVNGAGKSTWREFSQEWSSSGRRKRCRGNTVIGYFAQHQAEELNPSNEVLAEVEEVCENNPVQTPCCFGCYSSVETMFLKKLRYFREGSETVWLWQNY